MEAMVMQNFGGKESALLSMRKYSEWMVDDFFSISVYRAWVPFLSIIMAAIVKLRIHSKLAYCIINHYCSLQEKLR